MNKLNDLKTNLDENIDLTNSSNKEIKLNKL